MSQDSNVRPPAIFRAESSLEEQNNPSATRPRSPLPALQLATVYFVLICEPLSASVIFPFIAKAVNEMGVTRGTSPQQGTMSASLYGTHVATLHIPAHASLPVRNQRSFLHKVGIFRTLELTLTSTFSYKGCCVLQWGRLSDRIGRKPVLMIGLMGLTVSMLSFGLSKSFTSLIISRAIAGMLSGNIGVTKTMISELSDGSNRAVAFSLLPIAWTIGATSGPLIGGSLQHVADAYPETFTDPFWTQYPYFLPCLVVAAFALLTLLLCTFCTKETLPRRPRSYFKRNYGTIASPVGEVDEKENRSISQVLTKAVIVAILNYGCIAVLEISYYALLTVFLAVPVRSGGLGLQPQKVGVVLATIGSLSGVIQLVVYPSAYRRFGLKFIYRAALLSFLVIFPSFVIMHMLAELSGLDDGSLSHWHIVMLSLVLVCNSVVDMGFSSIFVYVAAACPAPDLLGATNGIAQSVISFTRAFGPAVATALFAYSVEHRLANGYAVYWCFASFSLVALALSTRLPSSVEDQDGHDHIH
ncbi:MFS general substrate transporter [Cantharellus anzutake]|uniref:MFS general substrate transporter n=1 Tax=Cantharellus anzutake TaxID=1750568 RepID=UPI001908ED30|nr:MFS general substrate transporter [Cantharellus anzutake]KAF8325457.1 MFS general substrate transporter [Cantharellus anzutake]